MIFAFHKWIMRVPCVNHTRFMSESCAFHPYFIRHTRVSFVTNAHFIRELYGMHTWIISDPCVKHTQKLPLPLEIYENFGLVRVLHAIHLRQVSENAIFFCAHKTRIDQFYPWSIRDSSVIPMWLRLYLYISLLNKRLFCDKVEMN